jgi:hypothetical protein
MYNLKIKWNEKIKDLKNEIIQLLPGGLVPNAEPLESGACERLQIYQKILFYKICYKIIINI